MKVKKFPQSCLLFNIGNQKILIDPGNTKFEDKFTSEWKIADAILITHKHGDHCKVDTIAELGIPVYSCAEVAQVHPSLKVNIVRQGKTFTLGNVKIEVTHATHGFRPSMKGTTNEVLETIGFILDDGKTRAYITGDTICFNNDYSADYIFAPAQGNCVTMDALGCALFTKMIGAKKLFVVHFDFYELPQNTADILTAQEIDFEIMQNGKEYVI